MLISAHVRFLAAKREMAVSNSEELLDTELFIHEVGKYPEIWNVAAESTITAPRREVHGLMFVGCFVKDSTRRMRGIKMKYVSTLFKFSYIFINDMKLNIYSTIVAVQVLCRICEIYGTINLSALNYNLFAKGCCQHQK